MSAITSSPSSWRPMRWPVLASRTMWLIIRTLISRSRSMSPLTDRSLPESIRLCELKRFQLLDGEVVVIEHLASDGTYVRADSSRFLPIKADEIARWLVEEDVTDQLTWERRLRSLDSGRTITSNEPLGPAALRSSSISTSIALDLPMAGFCSHPFCPATNFHIQRTATDVRQDERQDLDELPACLRIGSTNGHSAGHGR